MGTVTDFDEFSLQRYNKCMRLGRDYVAYGQSQEQDEMALYFVGPVVPGFDTEAAIARDAAEKDDRRATCTEQPSNLPRLLRRLRRWLRR